MKQSNFKSRLFYNQHQHFYLFLATTAITAAIFSINSGTLSHASAYSMPSLADKRATAEFACSTCNGPHYSQGLQTFRVPMALYELNRARIVSSMLQELQAQNQSNGGGSIDEKPAVKGLILLEGGKQQTRYDTDHEPVFRQESYFHWVTGISESEVYVAISLPSGEATVFVPEYGLTYEIFCGRQPCKDVIKLKYGVENVLGLSKLPAFVAKELGVTVNKDGSDDETNCDGDSNDSSDTNDVKLYLLKGLNTDSGNMATPASYPEMSSTVPASKIDTTTLFDCMAECRTIKTKAELEVMRYTHWVSSMAHVEVMRSAKVGMMEYQLESLFMHHTYTHGGCRHMSYTCTCACGPNPAVLHYGHAGAPNNRQLVNGDIALLDMGAEYHCYASDITCSFPVNGCFTPNQRMIYEAVLLAQVNVLKVMKPGVTWPEMHRTAERAILQKLVEGGLLIGDSIEDMIDADLGAIFMPHGLGHLIGLDTHDVGGYARNTPPRSERPGLNKLRTARVLEEGMVLTVEPGCYFIDALLDIALANPKQRVFFNVERLNNEFRGFGGVRLEDGILVTKDGCENLTNCPRAVKEVLDVMGGKSWPPDMDIMPEMKRTWVTREGGKMIKLTMPFIK